jgi:hypothetical protein
MTEPKENGSAPEENQPAKNTKLDRSIHHTANSENRGTPLILRSDFRWVTYSGTKDTKPTVYIGKIEDFVEQMFDPSNLRASKYDCPLFQCIEIKEGATRGNAAVESHTALVIDYDEGLVPMSVAVEFLRSKGFLAIFYRSFTSPEDGTKFRVIIPTQRYLDSAEMKVALARVNRMLSEINIRVTSESYVPGQAFFFGFDKRLAGQSGLTEVVGVRFLDTDAPDFIAIPPLFPVLVEKENELRRRLFPNEVEAEIIRMAELAGGKLGTGEGRTELLKGYLVAVKRQNPNCQDEAALTKEAARIVDQYFVNPETMQPERLVDWVLRIIDFEPRTQDIARAFDDGEGGTVIDREARQLLGIERPTDLLTDEEREHFRQVLAGIPRSKNGALVNKQQYVKQVIDAGGRMFLCPRFDGFKNEIIIQALDGEIRPIQDRDITEIKLQLEGVGFPSIGTDSARELINLIAYENRIDSAEDWINSLEWDGVSRVDSFLVDYASATEDPSEYTTAVSRYMFTALAGRLIDPGVKADAAPILVGAQGARKSSLVAAIAPDPEMFTEISLDVGADTPRKLNGKAVCELSELAGLGKRDLETWKSFLTQRDDRWIPKYQEHSIRRPRRCVFIGTSNREDFLRDETGHRRFLPVRVGRCYPERLAEVRDQLWAEGAALYRESGVAYADAERLAIVQHDGYIQVPELAELVSKILDGIVGSKDWAKEPWVTTGQIIDWSEGKLGNGRGHETKVGMALHFLKWRKQRVRRDGALVYIYHRPMKA